jgi:hypothetical protein
MTFLVPFVAENFFCYILKIKSYEFNKQIVNKVSIRLKQNLTSKMLIKFLLG